MTRFSKLTLDVDGKPVESDIREIRQSDMLKCPHVIMMAEHYCSDGSCRCTDPDHVKMAEWGYVWQDDRWQSKEDEESLTDG